MCLRLVNVCEISVILFSNTFHMQDYKGMFNESGMPKPRYPSHWKGENNIYCAGFSKRGLEGIAYDAQEIANHISLTMNARNVPSSMANIAGVE